MSRVIARTQSPAVAYAAAELARCLQRVTGKGPDDDGIIEIGVGPEIAGGELPSVPDAAVDDAIFIDIADGAGRIAGSNPRSVLLGVYRYLNELGCRWVRPGVDGEYLPRLDAVAPVKLAERPSYRHRGICIEGAVSLQHVLDIIEWMPRNGFNGYFIQFREAYTFFSRWYTHESNPHMEGTPLSVDQARQFTARAVEEIRKRGLLYHAVGHGWTCEPFGISGLGWDVPEVHLTDDVRQYLAQVDGKRELWGGIPLNTNLCYGNPEVRRLIIEEIARYSAEHPEIDLLHFWLADGSNNQCECELCRDTRPSDFYVQMLNDLDSLLTERGIDTRIVFLIYVDLLWPPERERIANPDRFVLMFAPITRTYSASFSAKSPLPELSPYERNKLRFPYTVEDNVAFLRAWQKDFPGDSFDFDYHMMWDHLKDPAWGLVPRVIWEDMKGLRDIGLGGYVSCQVQRAFFPTGIAMAVMGRTLWNTDADYYAIARDLYTSSFGADGPRVLDYMQQLSELFDPRYIRGEKPAVNEQAAENFARIPALLDELAPLIDRNQNSDNDCWAKSWFYLQHAVRMFHMLAGALEARSRGDEDRAETEWEKLHEYVVRNETVLHPVLDVFLWVRIVGGLFRRKAQ